MKSKINYKFEYSFKTDPGRVRLSNQDNVKIIKNQFNNVLMIVADGMGGHNKGDYASKLCVDFIEDKFIKRKKPFRSKLLALSWLRYAIYKCNSFIYKTAEQSNMYKGMGTTIVACLLFDDIIVNINVGDSRAYIIKDNQISMLSKDQSLVKYLEDSGQISKEEASERKDNNILLSALGTQPSTNQNFKTSKYQGEIILLCSDGLFHVLKDEEILSIINKNLNLDETCKELIDTTNNYGGPDNISVAILKGSI